MGNDAFHWGLIDHVLVGLKLSEMSEEMRDSINAEEGDIRRDNTRNGGRHSCGSATFAA